MPEVTSLKVKTEITVQLKSGHGHTVKGKLRTFAPQSLVVQA